MAEEAVFGGVATGNVDHHRLIDRFSNILSGGFFPFTPRFPHQNDRIGTLILIQHLQPLEKRRPDDRIAANPHPNGLAQTGLGQREGNFVGQRSAATEQSNGTGGIKFLRMGSQQDFSRYDNPRTARPHDEGFGIFGFAQQPHHIQGGHPFREDNQLANPRSNGFEGGIEGTIGMNANRGDIDRAHLLPRLFHQVKNGNIVQRLPAQTGTDPRNNASAVAFHQCGIGRTERFGNSLH